MTGSPSDPRPDAGPARDTAPAGTSVGEFAGVGIQFAVSIIGSVFLGQWLDRKLGTAPWLLYIGVILGAGLGFYSMYRKLMAAQARDDADTKARRGDQS